MQGNSSFGRLPALSLQLDSGNGEEKATALAKKVPETTAGEQPAPEAAPAVPQEKPKPYAWILHPAVDLFFVCGGLIWVFGVLMWVGLIPNAPTGPFMSAAAITALILFSMPHQTATYLRVYDSKTTSKKLGKLVAIFGLVCIGLGAVVMISPFWASIIGRITLGFSFQHFYLQAYGIVLLYCYKRGFFLSKLEKNTLHCLTYAGVASAVTNVFCRPNLNVSGFELIHVTALPLGVRSIFDFFVITLAVAFTGLMVKRYIKTKQLIPWPAVLSLISCFLFLGYLERYASFLAIAILGQALFHSPQYLVVTLAYHIKERMPSSIPTTKVWTQVFKPVGLKYLAFVLGAGWISATLLGPYLQEYLDKFTVYPAMGACAYYCAMNLHHYISDGLIWKMKDKQTLATLVS